MFRVEEIQARIRRHPFVPLRIVTDFGESYDVTNPKLVLLGEQSIIVGTPSNRNPTVCATANRVGLMHIIELQDLPLPPASGTS
jgi:hypothetical protein